MKKLREEIASIDCEKQKIDRMIEFNKFGDHVDWWIDKSHGNGSKRIGIALNDREKLRVDQLISKFIEEREAAIKPIIDKLEKVESLIYSSVDCE
jgi:hypothetical protein